MILRTYVAALVLCASGLWPASADACSCAASGAACDAAWRADAVFVGHVVSIESVSTGDRGFGGRQAQMAVVEAFRGLQLSQVTVMTGNGQADCGYSFAIGASYLVYAHRSPDGRLSTTICSRTRPVGEATDDLAYLRSIADIAPGTLARVAGRVQILERPGSAGGQLKPVAGVAVTATGAGRTFAARANGRGEFELAGLPLGKYDVIATAPEGYASLPSTLEIRDPRGCGTTALFLRYDGRVTGRVVDARGNGVRGLAVELALPADVDTPGGGDRLHAWTAADGAFELKLVAPGDYLLGFNSIRGFDGHFAFPRAFYPGVMEPAGAGKVVVPAGGRVRLQPPFVVPEKIKLVTVEGIVLDEAGSPVREAMIALRDNTEGPNTIGPRVVTGADGRFTFALVDGGKYDVHVMRFVGTDSPTRKTQTSIVPFRASADAPMLRVVLKPNAF